MYLEIVGSLPPLNLSFSNCKVNSRFSTLKIQVNSKARHFYCSLVITPSVKAGRFFIFFAHIKARERHATGAVGVNKARCINRVVSYGLGSRRHYRSPRARGSSASPTAMSWENLMGLDEPMS